VKRNRLRLAFAVVALSIVGGIALTASDGQAGIPRCDFGAAHRYADSLGVPYRAVHHLSKSLGDRSEPILGNATAGTYLPNGGKRSFAALCLDACRFSSFVLRS
jgi:hypothetical protein